MNIKKVLVGEIMSSPLITAVPEDPVQKIIQSMAHWQISAVAVAERGEAHLISHGTIIKKLSERGGSITGVRAQDFIGDPVPTINHRSTISSAVKRMHEYGVKRLVVENDLGENVGIITVKDILKWNFEVFRPATPLFLVVVMEVSGIVLFQYKFPAAELSILDADLLGSSFSAISSLTSEILKDCGKVESIKRNQSGKMKVICREDYVFMIETDKILRSILVADHEAFNLRKNLKDFLQAVEKENQELFAKTPPGVPPMPMGRLVVEPFVEKYFAPYLKPVNRLNPGEDPYWM